ncbi:hypothetical protein [Bradyrhizobium sp. CB3481]|uniref:hypothetical protein n=1 Tax=Bradyrhizobium sp. CB3481 TaxID=3039158 RepID=UPI0024B1A5C2|nr:hypothetical protein [Bradyrhizobium sp. CB3481]WFU14376.1 hypothetical protein QA643_24630 [Bradyrhizobium sp. CB3481]
MSIQLPEVNVVAVNQLLAEPDSLALIAAPRINPALNMAVRAPDECRSSSA